MLNPRLAADFVVDLREGFLTVEFLAHLVIEAVVKHLVELLASQERVGIQHLEAEATTDVSLALYSTPTRNTLEYYTSFVFPVSKTIK